jgi:hypothetical protein
MQTPRQRPVKPAPVVKVEGKVEQFLKVVAGAGAMADVLAAYSQARFTQPEMDNLKSKIEASPSIRKKIEQLQAQATAEAMPRVTQNLQRDAAARFERMKKLETAKQNRVLRDRAVLIKKDIAASLKAGEAISPDRKRLCDADAPVIEKIYGPVTPGVEFGIEGRGLGSSAGFVDVMVDGHVFRANINSWGPCFVYAELYSGVEGVRGRGAMVVLETNSGKKTDGTAAFTPILDFRTEEAPDITLRSYCCGNHGDWKVFDFQLQNDWYVCDAFITVYEVAGNEDVNGQAQITDEPRVLWPNCWGTTKIHGGVSGFQAICIRPYLFIAGPKGLPHRF